MHYNFDEIIDRSNTDSTKHDASRIYNPYLPEDYISMTVADMDFPCAQPILDAMHARLDRRILGYANYPDTMSQTYYDAICGWLKRRHNIEATREHISFSASVIGTCREAINSMSKDGDGVMIHVPCYPYIHNPISEFDRKTVRLPLKWDEDHRFYMDFDELEREASKEENTLLILCSPHNPSGRVWTEEELRTVAEICFRNNVKIFVDEIHNDLIRKDVKMISLTALYPGDPRIVTAMSIAKSFNCAGNQHSYSIVYDKELKAKFDDSRYGGSPNPLSTTAMIAAYNEGEEWLDQVNAYLDDNLDFLENYLRENMPRVGFRKPEGTYLAWLDLRNYGLTDEELYVTISKAGLSLEYASDFIDNASGFARINTACPRSVLAKACGMLKKALEG